MTLCRSGPGVLSSSIRTLASSDAHQAPKFARSFSSTRSRLDALPQTSTAQHPSASQQNSEDGSTAIVGSRRRRAAIASSLNLPFEQLPYQCFQEARKVLQADRQEKLGQISQERARIARLQAKLDANQGKDHTTSQRIQHIRRHINDLKILADINDPAVKKRFEDGEGDMSKPIYRYLADRKWRSYRRPLLVQRITQMFIVPDLIPHIDPIIDVGVSFGRKSMTPGDFVDSRISESPPTLSVQPFDRGERLVTVILVDSDVPDIENDSFVQRCHFMAANIPISPTSTSVSLGDLSPHDQTILPWQPPFAHKGSPYHRLSTFIVIQPEGRRLDIKQLQSQLQSQPFRLRGFLDRNALRPSGVHLFRTIFDENTPRLMARLGIEGQDVEFRRPRVEPLKKPQLPLKKKKNRGLLPSKRLSLSRHSRTAQ